MKTTPPVNRMWPVIYFITSGYPARYVWPDIPSEYPSEYPQDICLLMKITPRTRPQDGQGSGAQSMYHRRSKGCLWRNLNLFQDLYNVCEYPFKKKIKVHIMYRPIEFNHKWQQSSTCVHAECADLFSFYGPQSMCRGCRIAFPGDSVKCNSQTCIWIFVALTFLPIPVSPLPPFMGPCPPGKLSFFKT